MLAGGCREGINRLRFQRDRRGATFQFQVRQLDEMFALRCAPGVQLLRLQPAREAEGYGLRRLGVHRFDNDGEIACRVSHRDVTAAGREQRTRRVEVAPSWLYKLCGVRGGPDGRQHVEVA